MPLTPEQASTITAGAQVASSGINAMAQANLNKKTRRWNEAQIAQQRQWSLQDWTMQNEYNSPQAQMARLKAAGLNPNLIYGKIETGSQPIRQTQGQQWNPKSANVDLNAAQILGQYFDTRFKDAQTDNVKSQNTLIAQQALLAAAQTSKTLQDTEAGKFDLSQKQRLADTNADILNATLRNISADINQKEATTAKTLTENEIMTANKENTIKSAAIQVLQQRATLSKTKQEEEQIKNNIIKLKQNVRLDNFEETLNKVGLTKTDPRWMRVVDKVVSDPTSTWDSLKSWWKNLINK